MYDIALPIILSCFSPPATETRGTQPISSARESCGNQTTCPTSGGTVRTSSTSQRVARPADTRRFRGAVKWIQPSSRRSGLDLRTRP